MSMLHFSSLVERAKKRLEQQTKLVEPVMISTSCTHVLFLHEHISLLEEQLGASQNLVEDWKLEAKRTQRQLDAILGSVSPTAKQSLLDIIANTK